MFPEASDTAAFNAGPTSFLRTRTQWTWPSFGGGMLANWLADQSGMCWAGLCSNWRQASASISTCRVPGSPKVKLLDPA